MSVTTIYERMAESPPPGAALAAAGEAGEATELLRSALRPARSDLFAVALALAATAAVVVLVDVVVMLTAGPVS